MNRKSLIFVIIIILLIVVSASYFYFRIYRLNEIITLGPDSIETKKKPEEPGGIVIPNSDSLVYEKLQKTVTKNRKTNILPEPELPINLSNKIEENKVVYVDSIDEILANIDNYDVPIVDLAQKEENVLPSDNKEVSLPDDDIDPKLNVSGSSLNIIASTENRFKFDVDIVSSESEGYKIQLYLSLSEAEAHKFWQEAIKRYAKILSGANLIIKKIDGKNNRKLYVVMAGTFPSINHAKLICNRLIARKQNCIVTK